MIKTLRILTICDEDRELKRWTIILNQLNLQAGTLFAPQLHAAPSLASGYDLIVIDMDNRQSALSLCAILRPTHNGAILLFADNPSEADMLAGYEAGADDYLAKPLGDQLLQAKVRTWCNRIKIFREARFGTHKGVPLTSKRRKIFPLAQFTKRLTRLQRSFLAHPALRSRRGFGRRG